MEDTSRMIPGREHIPAKDRWDLTPLFASGEEWEKLFSAIEAAMDGYNRFRGRLGESAEMLAEAFAFDLDLSRRMERLFTYAHLRSDEDTADQKAMGVYQRTVNLNMRVSEIASFMTPEIQAIPGETMKEFLADERLRDIRFALEKILRYKPHTLSGEIEQILAMSGEVAHAPSQIFSQLDNADLRFGMIKDESGAEVELSHGNFITFLMSADRGLRERAFFQYYKTYEEHRHGISAALASSIKKDYFYSRVRKYESCRGGALFQDNIEEAVYDNLIAAVRKNLPPLFSYLEYRRKVLGLSELRFYDTYVPIVGDVRFRMPFEEAVGVCAKALAPLGEEYTGTLTKGLLTGWVDRYENRGKRSGAYSSGCYDSPPYILMNYRDDNINSLYTLIHEAGHSMHSHYSNASQPFLYHDYTIFTAEVASTFNETLLSRYLLDNYRDDPKMKAYILNREIDNIRGTLFRQTMFAEFEKITHERVERNDPLTLDDLTGAYQGLLKTYFGEAVVIDEALKLECLRIPHFYSAFYVYKYATGISAAIALADRVLREGAPARDDYLGFLKMGGSRYPLEELLAAGVDMRSAAPVENAILHFGELVKGLREVLPAGR